MAEGEDGALKNHLQLHVIVQLFCCCMLSKTDACFVIVSLVFYMKWQQWPVYWSNVFKLAQCTFLLDLLKLCWLMSWKPFLFGFDSINGIMRHINLGKTKYDATEGRDVKCTAHRCVNEYLGGGVGWICTTQTHLTGSHFGCVDERQRSRPSDCSLEGNHFPSMKTK